MDNEVYGRLRALYAAVLVLSFLTLAAAALVGAASPVWIRGTVVAVIAVVLLALAAKARRGSRGAYRRMCVMSAVAPVAVVVIVALPHDGFPLWMKAEQAVVGALLLAAVLMAGRRSVRRAYAGPAER